MNDNFLLKTKISQRLFFDYAKDMPIIDYHCHLNPKEIAEDTRYSNLTQLWLGGDHYKWRFMRAMGVDEKYITGNADDYDKFLKYASVIQYAIGNPLYHWTHLELSRFFGIDEYLTEKTAPAIWKKTLEILKSDDFSVRKLIVKSNVKFIGTTDDPCDDLKYHKEIKNISDFDVTVAPSFRPDKAVNIEKDEFADYIKTLSNVSGVPVSSFEELKKALSNRVTYFNEYGCRASDSAVSYVPFEKADDAVVDSILKKKLNGENITSLEEEQYKTAILLFLAGEYSKYGWVMQLHSGALRNNNTKMFNILGPDTGYDSIDDNKLAAKLAEFMDELNTADKLPKTILYSLNANDNDVLETISGCFQGGGIKGKIQLGSAWWFNDNIDGMTEQIKALARNGALAAFVGMLTDSRSFLSYPRHEYFRRILCSVIGEWVENGEFMNDKDILKQIVQDICYNNAKEYFNI